MNITELKAIFHEFDNLKNLLSYFLHKYIRQYN